jgi:hypothetical protein
MPEDVCHCTHQLQERDFRGTWPCNVEGCICIEWEAA